MRYWYQIKFCYRDLGADRAKFDWHQQIGVVSKSDIVNRRKVCKAIPPLHKTKSTQHLINNGILTVEIVCYIGRFKKV